ncbi:MAG: hypothetical protein GC186_05885 [Rhodobacteraceae bacterium]|nr:hypothetical protein [Paracoccaceae bacterium]
MGMNILAALVTAGGLAFGLAGTAQAETNSTMTTCSTQYKADKAANKVPAGQTWSQYYSACAAKLKADAGGSTTTTATTTATTTTTTAAADDSTATGGNTTMATCSARYKADKAANKVPEGQTWPKYYSACAADLKAASADEANPPEPSKVDTSTTVATADKNGKPYTPGQIAAHKRIKECGQMWQTDKAANKIPTGQTWPKYWSACNTKLKAAGN